jgi:hypothetical protein
VNRLFSYLQRFSPIARAGIALVTGTLTAALVAVVIPTSFTPFETFLLGLSATAFASLLGYLGTMYGPEHRSKRDAYGIATPSRAQAYIHP